MRIGMGYDVHRLVDGRKLVLGGVTIPFEGGLLGHSDADVLVHAVCDALLGAAGMGDIGQHFPDTDSTYKDMISLKMLARVCDMIRSQGFVIENIDSTILAEAPRIAPYKEEIKKNIAKTVEIASKRINIKATTTEGLGGFATGKGIGAISVALLKA